MLAVPPVTLCVCSLFPREGGWEEKEEGEGGGGKGKEVEEEKEEEEGQSKYPAL